MKKFILLFILVISCYSCSKDNPVNSTDTLIYSQNGLLDSFYAFSGTFFQPLDSLDLSSFNELTINFTYSLRNNGINSFTSPTFSIQDSSFNTLFRLRKDPGTYISQFNSSIITSPQSYRMFYYNLDSGPISDGYISIRDLKIYGR